MKYETRLEMLKLSDIVAAPYNPREDIERGSDEYKALRRSIELNGMVEPPVVNLHNMRCIGGNQRLVVLRDLGWKEVLCSVIDQPDESKEMKLCLALNRIEGRWDTDRLGDLLRDDEVLEFETGFDRDEVLVYRQLGGDGEGEDAIGSAMPVVIGEAGNVINGIGRLQVAAEAGRKVIACVKVRPEQEAFASSMLNLLSMDFDMESTYADDLRFNSFMRERNTRETDAEGNAALGDGFFKGVFPKNCGRDFCKLEGAALETWRRHYGSSVVDFGAGKLNNTRTLRKAGIQVSAFEPYFVTVGEKIHKEKSLEIAARFLDEVEAGTPYSSVFISSVFNSVPFMADRKQIAVIAAALCAPDGMVVCWCQSNKAPQFVNTKKKFLAAEKVLTFDLDYEPNTILGDIGAHPKVQKGHTEEEMRAIFAPCFRTVKRLEMITKFWYMEAADPIVDPAALAAALDFEFELPYPDGSRMGLSQRAREAFEHRLGIRLPPPTKGEAK